LQQAQSVIKDAAAKAKNATKDVIAKAETDLAKAEAALTANVAEIKGKINATAQQAIDTLQANVAAAKAALGKLTASRIKRAADANATAGNATDVEATTRSIGDLIGKLQEAKNTLKDAAGKAANATKEKITKVKTDLETAEKALKDKVAAIKGKINSTAQIAIDTLQANVAAAKAALANLTGARYKRDSISEKVIGAVVGPLLKGTPVGK